MRIRVPICPKCKSDKIDRVNEKVVVYERILIDHSIDFMVEGGNEVRVTSNVLRSDETQPPFIEELESDELEFICADCGYHFRDCKTDEEFLDYIMDNHFYKWKEIEDAK